MSQAIGFVDKDKELDLRVGCVGSAKGGCNLLEEVVIVLQASTARTSASRISGNGRQQEHGLTLIASTTQMTAANFFSSSAESRRSLVPGTSQIWNGAKTLGASRKIEGISDGPGSGIRSGTARHALDVFHPRFMRWWDEAKGVARAHVVEENLENRRLARPGSARSRVGSARACLLRTRHHDIGSLQEQAHLRSPQTRIFCRLGLSSSSAGVGGGGVDDRPGPEPEGVG